MDSAQRYAHYIPASEVEARLRGDAGPRRRPRPRSPADAAVSPPRGGAEERMVPEVPSDEAELAMWRTSGPSAPRHPSVPDARGQPQVRRVRSAEMEDVRRRNTNPAYRFREDRGGGFPPPVPPVPPLPSAAALAAAETSAPRNAARRPRVPSGEGRRVNSGSTLPPMPRDAAQNVAAARKHPLPIQPARRKPAALPTRRPRQNVRTASSASERTASSSSTVTLHPVRPSGEAPKPESAPPSPQPAAPASQNAPEPPQTPPMRRSQSTVTILRNISDPYSPPRRNGQSTAPPSEHTGDMTRRRELRLPGRRDSGDRWEPSLMFNDFDAIEASLNAVGSPGSESSGFTPQNPRQAWSARSQPVRTKSIESRIKLLPRQVQERLPSTSASMPDVARVSTPGDESMGTQSMLHLAPSSMSSPSAGVAGTRSMQEQAALSTVASEPFGMHATASEPPHGLPAASSEPFNLGVAPESNTMRFSQLFDENAWSSDPLAGLGGAMFTSDWTSRAPEPAPAAKAPEPEIPPTQPGAPAAQEPAQSTSMQERATAAAEQWEALETPEQRPQEPIAERSTTPQEPVPQPQPVFSPGAAAPEEPAPDTRAGHDAQQEAPEAPAPSGAAGPKASAFASGPEPAASAPGPGPEPPAVSTVRPVPPARAPFGPSPPPWPEAKAEESGVRQAPPFPGRSPFERRSSTPTEEMWLSGSKATGAEPAPRQPVFAPAGEAKSSLNPFQRLISPPAPAVRAEPVQTPTPPPPDTGLERDFTTALDFASMPDRPETAGQEREPQEPSLPTPTLPAPTRPAPAVPVAETEKRSPPEPVPPRDFETAQDFATMPEDDEDELEEPEPAPEPAPELAPRRSEEQRLSGSEAEREDLRQFPGSLPAIWQEPGKPPPSAPPSRPPPPPSHPPPTRAPPVPPPTAWPGRGDSVQSLLAQQAAQHVHGGGAQEQTPPTALAGFAAREAQTHSGVLARGSPLRNVPRPAPEPVVTEPAKPADPEPTPATPSSAAERTPPAKTTPKRPPAKAPPAAPAGPSPNAALKVPPAEPEAACSGPTPDASPSGGRGAASGDWTAMLTRPESYVSANAPETAASPAEQGQPMFTPELDANELPWLRDGNLAPPTANTGQELGNLGQLGLPAPFRMPGHAPVSDYRSTPLARIDSRGAVDRDGASSRLSRSSAPKAALAEPPPSAGMAAAPLPPDEELEAREPSPPPSGEVEALAEWEKRRLERRHEPRSGPGVSPGTKRTVSLRRMQPLEMVPVAEEETAQPEQPAGETGEPQTRALSTQQLQRMQQREQRYSLEAINATMTPSVDSAAGGANGPYPVVNRPLSQRGSSRKGRVFPGMQAQRSLVPPFELQNRSVVLPTGADGRPQGPMCLECMMRDEDMIDVHVREAEVWERESDLDFYEAIRLEHQLRSERPDAPLEHPETHRPLTRIRVQKIAVGDALTAASLKEYARSARISTSQKQRGVLAFVQSQRKYLGLEDDQGPEPQPPAEDRPAPAPVPAEAPAEAAKHPAQPAPPAPSAQPVERPGEAPAATPAAQVPATPAALAATPTVAPQAFAQTPEPQREAPEASAAPSAEPTAPEPSTAEPEGAFKTPPTEDQAAMRTGSYGQPIQTPYDAAGGAPHAPVQAADTYSETAYAAQPGVGEAPYSTAPATDASAFAPISAYYEQPEQSTSVPVPAALHPGTTPQSKSSPLVNSPSLYPPGPFDDLLPPSRPFARGLSGSPAATSQASLVPSDSSMMDMHLGMDDRLRSRLQGAEMATIDSSGYIQRGPDAQAALASSSSYRPESSSTLGAPFGAESGQTGAGQGDDGTGRRSFRGFFRRLVGQRETTPERTPQYGSRGSRDSRRSTGRDTVPRMGRQDASGRIPESPHDSSMFEYGSGTTASPGSPGRLQRSPKKERQSLFKGRKRRSRAEQSVDASLSTPGLLMEQAPPDA